MKPWRVLVCGSNYGQIYFEALKRNRTAYQPVGLLARGSARSVALAQAEGAPLYRSVGELPGGIDLACVALGMQAAGVVLELIRRGIPMLCEHPQKPDFLARALKMAAGRVPFHLNAHFGWLAAPRTFISETRRLMTSELPLSLHVQATDRSLYGLLDIAGLALAGLRPGRFRAIAPSVLRGRMNGAVAAFEIQGSSGRRSLPDGSPGYLFDQRIAIGFPSGVLTMLSVAGPVVWNQNLGRINALDRPLWNLHSPAEECTGRRFQEMRIQANLAALEALARHVATATPPPEQNPSHILAVSRLWQRLATLAPPVTS